MAGHSDAAKSGSTEKGAGLTEAGPEGWGGPKHPLTGRETPKTDRPKDAAPVQEYVRRRPGRPRKNLLPWTPVVQLPVRKQRDELTAGPAPTSYFAVLRPERTYERRRPITCPVLRQELPKRVPERFADPIGRLAVEPAGLRPKPNSVSTTHSLPPVLDFPGPRVPPNPPAPAEVSGTTGLLCSQLEKLQKAAKSGNEEALLLLEQYKAFGKQRHHFSERMLLKCSLWRARSCYSYHCARRTQLFTLPGRTTLHRYGQLGSNS